MYKKFKQIILLAIEKVKNESLSKENKKKLGRYINKKYIQQGGK